MQEIVVASLVFSTVLVLSYLSYRREGRSSKAKY